MPNKLNVWVHVGEKRYGPDDDVPQEIADQIVNPDVWDEGGPSKSAAVSSDEAGERPRGNASRDSWAEYAAKQNPPVVVTEDMDRAAIIAAVDAGK